MRIIATIFFFLGFGSVAWSYNPEVANITLRDARGGWVIEMDFSKSLIDHELSDQVGEAQLAALDTEAYEQMLIDYVKKTLRLSQEGETLLPGTEGIRLSSDRAHLKFLIPDLEYPKSLVVEIPLFEGIEHQTNIFRVYHRDQQLFHVTLNSDNDFKAHLDFDSGKVELSYADVSSTTNRFFGLGFGIVAFLILSLVVSHKALAQEDA